MKVTPRSEVKDYAYRYQVQALPVHGDKWIERSACDDLNHATSMAEYDYKNGSYKDVRVIDNEH